LFADNAAAAATSNSATVNTTPPRVTRYRMRRKPDQELQGI
jgi:hypothetical protein